MAEDQKAGAPIQSAFQGDMIKNHTYLGSTPMRNCVEHNPATAFQATPTIAATIRSSSGLRKRSSLNLA